MKIAIYARYSSENQSEESITAQIRACTEYAARNGHVIVNTYIDRAMSARSDRRPEFQQMIADSSKQLFEAIVVHKLDRFSRDRFDHAVYRRELKKNGVQLLSVLENLDSSPESIVLESVLEGFSEYYSANLARETRKGLREIALQAKYTGGTVLYGYTVGADQRYKLNPTEAAVVRRIFNTCLTKQGYNKLLDELRKEGVKTRAGKNFTTSAFYYILKNPRYTGDYVYSPVGERFRNKGKSEIITVPNALPAIVSHEDFNAVQQILQERSHNGYVRAKEPFLLSGILYCGKCGSKLYGHRQKKPHKDYVYYSYECSSNTRRKECDSRSVPRDRMDHAVCDYIKQLLSPASVSEIQTALEKSYALEFKQRQEQILVLQKKLNGIEQRIDHAVDLLIDMPSDSLQKKIRSLETEKTDLENHIIKLKSKNTGNSEIAKQIQVCLGFDDLTMEEKQQIIRKIIKKITVHPDGDSVELIIESEITQSLNASLKLEVPPRIELGIKELQSTALPLGYGTVWSG